MLPTYLPKQNGGRDAVTHPTLGDIRNPVLPVLPLQRRRTSFGDRKNYEMFWVVQ